MGIFDKLSAQGNFQATQQMPQGNAQRSMQADVSRIKSGPAAFLRSRGYDIPPGMTDANQITQYLVQSNPILNARYQAITRALGGMGIKK